MASPDFVFTNASGYNEALEKLKTQVLSVTDDNSLQVILPDSFFVYSSNINEVSSQSNYPLFVIDESDELMKLESRQNSDIIFACYLCFNDNRSFETTYNQIISTFRKVFLEVYYNEFVITRAYRSSGMPTKVPGTGKHTPLWACRLDIVYNNVIY